MRERHQEGELELYKKTAHTEIVSEGSLVLSSIQAESYICITFFEREKRFQTL
jgi:hypothetical protein